MVESTVDLTAVELYQKLVAAFKVDAHYKVSFNKNVSKDVLDVILHLKGDLHVQDIVPNFPTKFELTVTLPDGSIKSFHQDNSSYMSAFDEDDFRKFMLEILNLN